MLVSIVCWGLFSLWQMYEGKGFYATGLSGFLILFFLFILIFTHLHYRFLKIQNQQNNLYRQQQALASIHNLINLRSPLAAMGEWAASPDFMQIIIEILIEKKPKTVVECGSGISSIVIGYILEKNKGGRLYSLEHLEEYAVKNTQSIKRHGLENQVQILHAPLIERQVNHETFKWYKTTQIADNQLIDVLVIDGPTGHRYAVLPILFHQLSDTAVIIIDDCKREKDSKNIMRWLQEFPLTAEWLDTEKGTCILRHKQ